MAFGQGGFEGGGAGVGLGCVAWLHALGIAALAHQHTAPAGALGVVPVPSLVEAAHPRASISGMRQMDAFNIGQVVSTVCKLRQVLAALSIECDGDKTPLDGHCVAIYGDGIPSKFVAALRKPRHESLL